ncbi:glycine betaine ABC transporter substrate-binding protein [Streptomyces canus]|uniref:glycine betaine ABC transporter substrate-binding protein n=1 Tax=Streptomyces canus TaxID=58343 RepID=UPI0035947FC9
MYALLLDQAGYKTSLLTVANRELYEPALESGQIDVVPEYAATFADWLNAKTNGADAAPVGSPDLDATMTALRRLAATRGLTVLDAGRAVDQNAFAVSASYARQHDLKTLSDLGASGLEVRLAAGDECVQRPYCEPGLKKTYGIDITGVDPKGVGTAQAEKAVQSGQDQMVLTTTTDATLTDFGLVLLADDQHHQSARRAERRPDDGRPGLHGSTGGQLAAVGEGRGADLSGGQGAADVRCQWGAVHCGHGCLSGQCRRTGLAR